MTKFQQWEKALYIGEFRTQFDGDEVTITSIPYTVPRVEYRIAWFALGKAHNIIVPEQDLEKIPEYIYRWVGPRGPSTKHYSNKSIAKGQATRNNGKLQYAQVEWKDQ